MNVDQIVDKKTVAIPGAKGDKGDKGDQGLPGTNGVPSDEAVAAYLVGPDSKSHTVFETKLDVTTAEATYGKKTNLVYFASSYPGTNIAGVLDAVKKDVASKPGSQAAIIVWDQPAGGLSSSATTLVIDNGIQLRGIAFHAGMAGAIKYTGDATAPYFLDYDGGDQLHGGSLFGGGETSGLNIQGDVAKALIHITGADQFRMSRLFLQNSKGGAFEINESMDFALRDIDMDGAALGSADIPIITVENSNMCYFNLVRIEEPHGIVYKILDSTTVRIFQGKIDGNTTKSAFPHIFVNGASDLELDQFSDIGSTSTPFEIIQQGKLKMSNSGITGTGSDSFIKARYPRISFNDGDGYHGRTAYHRFYPSITLVNNNFNPMSDWDLSGSTKSVLDLKAPYPVVDLRQERQNTTFPWYQDDAMLQVTKAMYNDGTSVHAFLSMSTDGGKTWTTQLFGDSGTNNLLLGFNLVDMETGRRARIVNNWASGEIRLAPVNGHSLDDITKMPARAGGYRLEWGDDRAFPLYMDGNTIIGAPTPTFRQLAKNMTSTVKYDAANYETAVALTGQSFTLSGPTQPPYVVADTSGGNIPDGKYAYAVSALVNGKETALGPTTVIAIKSQDGKTGKATLTWHAIQGATQYNVWRMDMAADADFTQFRNAGNSTTMTDTGDVFTAAAHVSDDNCPTGYYITDGTHNWLIEHNTADTVYVCGNCENNTDNVHMTNIPTKGLTIQCGVLHNGTEPIKLV